MINERIDKTIQINAPAAAVWRHLVTPELMKVWMLDTDMEIDIITDWKPGSPILMNGIMHGMKFKNTGMILQCEPEKILQYTHRSSLSRLPDVPGSYCMFTFQLTPVADGTTLHLVITNFPTETILRHLDFYWRSALAVMKAAIEKTSI